MAGEIVSIAVTVSLALLCVALVVAIVRLAKGPGLPDRVVALDLIAYLAISLIATFAIAADHPAFLDAATPLALIAFLGTIAFARYIQKQADQEEQP